MPTSEETPKWVATVVVAALKIDEPNELARVTYPKDVPMINFFFIGQFCGCNGSDSESYSTT